jgi:1-acyl-sn-glycerol-3-phosphate acyltransferase
VIRATIDRLFGVIAIALARGLHRTVAVTSLDAARTRGPRVLVVNHFNGFVDVVVLVAALGRLPRFVAKAGLRKVLPARPFLALAGVVYVQRVTDGEGTERNADAFAQCRDRLLKGDCIAIFPEGTTHDREALAPIRTGAARIALGSVAAGATGLRIVPVGLSYGDKTRLRNDVLVAGGRPIPVGDEGENDHVAVRGLTDQLTRGLDALVPGLEDPLDAWALERAAAVAERSSGHEPDLADRRVLARQLARAPEAARADVVEAAGAYSLALDLAGVDDAAVVGTDAPSITELVVRAVVTWLLAPFIATIALVNGPAIGAVVLVDRFVSTPVSKGTIRALVAVVLFPATWITVAALGTDGGLRITALVIGHALALLGALWLVEGDVAAARRWWRHYRARVASARIPSLKTRRVVLVRAVTAARTVTDRTASAP